jgi:hypothetical protein
VARRRRGHAETGNTVAVLCATTEASAFPGAIKHVVTPGRCSHAYEAVPTRATQHIGLDSLSLATKRLELGKTEIVEKPATFYQRERITGSTSKEPVPVFASGSYRRD